MASKERLDVLLVQQGFFDSREKAKSAVMAGLVFHGTERLEKPGMKIDSSLELFVKGAVHPYVSRGGLKLEKALRLFSLDVQNRIILDIGASTGGFTDCALQHGAKRVYAIDVGYNQLDWSLRNDERVEVMERINVRYLNIDQLTKGYPDIAVIDVSFISLKLIFPVILRLLTGQKSIIALIKPQFEAGREQVGKSGVIRDKNVHEQVLLEILTFASQLGMELIGLTFSPITGGEGNVEFLACWNFSETNKDSINIEWSQLVRTIVDEAHQTLRGSK